MQSLESKIDGLISAFEYYGYFVGSNAIPGYETEYHAALLKGLHSIELSMNSIQKNANCRGVSKRSLMLLHELLPVPCWGVEIRQL